MTRTLAEQFLDSKASLSLSGRLSEYDNVPLPAYSASASMYSSVGEMLRSAEVGYTNMAIALIGKARAKHLVLGKKQIAFAYVDLPNPNAQAFYIPADNSFGIAVDHNLFGLYIDIMTASMAVHSRPKLRRPQLTSIFMARLRRLLLRRVAKTYEERLAVSREMEMFYRATEEWHEEFRLPEHFARWFVVAHELAHIALGHLESDPTRRRAIIGDQEIPAAVAATHHEFEFAADMWALDLLMDAFTPGDDPEGEFVLMVNARLFFEAMYLLRLFLPHKDDIGGDIYGETHPPPDVRIEKLKAFCPALVQDTPTQYRDFWEACDVIRGLASDKRIQFAARQIQSDLIRQR